MCRIALASSNFKLDSNHQFFRPCDREIWQMTSKNNRTLLLYYIKLCASFHAMSYNLETLNSGQNQQFSVPCDFNRWPWKTIGHLSYAASSFVHHFIAIGEFNLELQSGNPQFGSKSKTFFSRVTFKLDKWPWKTIGHLFCDTSSFVHHFNAIGRFKPKLKSGNTQFGSKFTTFWAVWPRNIKDDLKNNRAPLLRYFKLCAIISYVNSTWSYGPETVKLGVDLCDLDLWPLTWTFCMDVTSVIGNNSWKFHDDTMMGTYSKRCDGQTDRQTDGQTDRQMDWTIHRTAWSQLKNNI